MDVEDRMELVTNGTEEIITKEELKNTLEKKKRPVSYVGIAPTGPPHIGYYRSIAKQIELIKAGFKHKVLIADLHAYLDDRKSPWEELDIRAKIYEKCLSLFGLEEAEFIKGSEFQTDKKYFMDILRISGFVTSKRAERAAREVCRMKNSTISELIYPLMQSLDCIGLDVDVAAGGIDQRHVYMLSREYLPKIGYKKPVCVFSPLGIGLDGNNKMSASEKKSRLELFASEKTIEKRIKNAYCPQGQTKENPILEYIRFIVFPRKSKLKIERPSKFGGDIIFNNYKELEKEFGLGKLHPLDLKKSLAKELTEILKPIRKYFEKHKDMLETFR